MKWLVRFFLSLNLLFLSGYNQLQAHAHQDNMRHSLIKAFDGAAYVHMDSIHGAHSSIYTSAPVNTEKAVEKFRVTDSEEEDDSDASRKYLEISNYFTDFFYALNVDCFWQHIRKSLAFCQHFSNSFTRTYLLFRAIRI